MSYLVNNASGMTANTDPFVNKAPIFSSKEIMFTPGGPLDTIYAQAATWGGASLQVYLSPMTPASQDAPIWLPYGAPITTNMIFNITARYGMIKIEISNASTTTQALTAILYGVHQIVGITPPCS